MNINTFSKSDLPIIFKIGYLSNNGLYTLAKIQNQKSENLTNEDIKNLKNLSELLKKIEKGKSKINEYKYFGEDSKNISIYWKLIKLIYSEFHRESFNQVQEKISEIKDNLDEFIKDIENETKIEDKKKIYEIKEFLTIISKRYQNVNFHHMHK